MDDLHREERADGGDLELRRRYDGKDKVYLAVWGSGLLEYDVRTSRWKEYLDPDGEMEIDLYRDDGINHVIVTGASPADGVLWISTYFG